MKTIIDFILFCLAWLIEHPIVIALIGVFVILIRLSDAALKKHIAAPERAASEEKERALKAAKEAAEEKRPVKTEPPQPSPAMPLPKPPHNIDGKQLAYHYQDVRFSPYGFADVSRLFGANISFSADNGKIVVSSNGLAVGEFTHGKLPGMISDWLNNNDPIWAVLTYYHETSHNAFFDIYFYRDELSRMLAAHPDAKRYKLSGSNTEEIQNDIPLCSPGASCSIEYDYEKEKYAVSCDWMLLGYLPPAAAGIIDESENGNIQAFISDIEENEDNGRLSVWVYLFE